ncbi:hypothetical protein HZB02_03695 [Candidatus Woesearchaeota archaeon]|nr:hypothetical protein [Candidatus Woesearchaeota archaeon]
MQKRWLFFIIGVLLLVSLATAVLGLSSNASSNPLDPDGDGLTNAEEQALAAIYGSPTNPNVADTDGDLFSDKEEVDQHTNPIDPADYPKPFGTLFMLGSLLLVFGAGVVVLVFFVHRHHLSSMSAAPRSAFDHQRLYKPSLQPASFRQASSFGWLMKPDLYEQTMQFPLRQQSSFIASFSVHASSLPRRQRLQPWVASVKPQSQRTASPHAAPPRPVSSHRPALHQHPHLHHAQLNQGYISMEELQHRMPHQKRVQTRVENILRKNKRLKKKLSGEVLKDLERMSGRSS